MSYLSELLNEARRRARITGKPLTPQELTGISESASQGAGERALAAKRLADERENQLRMQKSAKDALEVQETQKKYETAGNAYTLDKALGSPVQNSLTGSVKLGVNKGIDAMGLRPMASNVSDYFSGLTNNLAGNATAALPAASTVIPGITQTASMTPAASSIAAKSAMMNQIGAAPTMTTTAPTSATSTFSSVATPVGYVAAADAARNIWGGDLKRNYSDAGWSQKIARAPGAVLSIPGFGQSESEIATKIAGKDNPITKVHNFFGKAEEKVVGKPLDKIFNAVGKIFCFAKGTPVQMEDGTVKNVEDVALREQMLEGGAVFGLGVVLNDDLWEYKGVKLAGTHAVLENGKWVRVMNSRHGKPIEQAEPVEVYPIANENHVVISNGIVFADFAETDHGTNVNDAFRLEFMNTQDEWNKYLSDKYYREAA